MHARTRRVWMLLLLASYAHARAAEAPGATDREIASQLAAGLKGALTQALQVSPQSAIAVCNERAPEIAAKLSATHDVQVGRTALRVRNESNRPTAWQEDVLNDFQRRAAAGEPLASMEYSATVARHGVTEHRYMKAIVTEALCVTCHGQQLAPGLQQAIAAKYPSDAATGFSVGDLRGAVYVVRPVTSPR
ncbi:MAG: DUF3365 domain-containing protein [Pseudomonadota bacterium]|nr:DUF3365 domain-containing protein [Pseudomonadota bacterium]